MPESQQSEKGTNIVLDKILSNPNISVIDFGAGEGKWGKLLNDKVSRIDGVEVWNPYVDKYKLHSYYNNLYEMDMRDFILDLPTEYSVAILGDVFEHVTREHAITFLDNLKKNVNRIFLTIPVTVCIQDGNAIGNPYETHHYQWSDKEIRYDLGFELLNVSVNDNGLVAVGCYEWIK
jgi:cyclopropane fatty-acyl-phospholipid synthase-like methyltransferase